MSIVKESTTGQRGSGGNRTVSLVVSSGEQIIAVSTTQDGNTSNLGCSGITRDSQSFTKIAGYGGSGGTGEPVHVDMWYLASPNVGTNDAVAAFNGAINECTITFYVLSGADASSLIETYNGSTDNGSSGALSVSTTTDGCFLIYGIVSEATLGSVGSGQTQDASYIDQGFENTKISSKDAGTAGSKSMSTSMDWGASYAHMVVAIKPSSVAVVDTYSLMRHVQISGGLM